MCRILSILLSILVIWSVFFFNLKTENVCPFFFSYDDSGGFTIVNRGLGLPESYFQQAGASTGVSLQDRWIR